MAASWRKPRPQNRNGSISAMANMMWCDVKCYLGKLAWFPLWWSSVRPGNWPWPKGEILHRRDWVVDCRPSILVTFRERKRKEKSINMVHMWWWITNYFQPYTERKNKSKRGPRREIHTQPWITSRYSLHVMAFHMECPYWKRFREYYTHLRPSPKNQKGEREQTNRAKRSCTL